MLDINHIEERIFKNKSSTIMLYKRSLQIAKETKKKIELQIDSKAL